jgi:hypothetical protein
VRRSTPRREAFYTGMGLLMLTKNDLNMFAFLNQLSMYFVNSSFSVVKNLEIFLYKEIFVKENETFL